MRTHLYDAKTCQSVPFATILLYIITPYSLICKENRLLIAYYRLSNASGEECSFKKKVSFVVGDGFCFWGKKKGSVLASNLNLLEIKVYYIKLFRKVTYSRELLGISSFWCRFGSVPSHWRTSLYLFY